MAEVKNKVVTVESLATVNTHNKNTYMTKVDPTGSGTLSMTGDGDFSGSVNMSELIIGNVSLTYDTTEKALKISFIADSE